MTIGGSQYVSAFVPVKANDGTVIGLLGLSRKSTTLADAQRNITRTLFLITLAVVLIAALLAWLSGGRVTKPIRSLTSAARQLRAGQLTARTRVESRNAFNGSTRAARRAGSSVASIATTASVTATPPKTSGSLGDTPNSSD